MTSSLFGGIMLCPKNHTNTWLMSDNIMTPSLTILFSIEIISSFKAIKLFFKTHQRLVHKFHLK